MFLKTHTQTPPTIYGALTCAFSIFVTLFVLAASGERVAMILV